MSLLGLTQKERDIILRCLRAAVEGPFFPDWEFHTLFGLKRSEVAALLARWPALDDSDDEVRCAIGNSLNNLLGYPHGIPLEEWVGESESEVERISQKWRHATESDVPGGF
jgi:hypothetical protein